MDDVIIIEIEGVSTCFGMSAKFSRKGQDGFMQCDVKNALDNMYEIRNRYKRATGKDVMFIVKDAEGTGSLPVFRIE